MKRIIILQIVLLASVAASAADPNLVGWWKFDDGNGTIAHDSAGSNDGNLINGPTWTTGLIGGGLKFDGVNDYVEVPYNDSLAPGHITLSAWAQPDIVRGMMLIGKSNFYDATSEQYALAINTDGGPMSSIKRNSLCAAGQGWYEVHSTHLATVGQWCLITSTWDGNVFKIYINGELNSSNSSVPAGLIDFCPGGTLRFGIWWSKGLSPFKGVMDDIRIYNRALSAEEIQQLYEESLPELTGLKITGPNEVAEESIASYKAIAQYDDGSTKDVTALAEWRAEPNSVAVIYAGQLATGQALYPKCKIKISAEYTEDQIDVNAQKQVSILAICPQGSALQFDGINDYVDVQDSASLRFTQNDSFSICLWVNPASSGYFLSKMRGQAQRNVFGYQTSWNNGSNNFSFVIDQSGIMNTIVSTPNGSAPAGNWYNVAYIYDKKNMKIFLNGQLSATGVFAGNTGTTSPDNNLTLGVRSHDAMLELFFKGELDDAHIYNRVLSTEEIQAIMHLKSTGSEPNLVAYWDFDAGAGQIAADVSGHSNNGVLGSSSGIDTADPCWVESEVPVGKCTTEQVLGRNLFGAIDDKKAANLLIAGAKAKEQASICMVDELRSQVTDINQQDAFKAKAQIRLAITQEELVSRQIDMTIKRLEDALRTLDYAVDSNSEPPPWGWGWKWGWGWQWSCGPKNKNLQNTPPFSNNNKQPMKK
jgi:hypothetical protein